MANGTPPRWFVWEWTNSQGEPKYVGIGRLDKDDRHPADVLWDQRIEFESHLTNWLRGLKKQPRRSKTLPSLALHRQDAKGLFFSRRKQLKEEGITLLLRRPFGTSIGGGHHRAVVSPNGDVFVSVREAARDTGLSASQITRRCKSKNSDWRYLNAD